MPTIPASRNPRRPAHLGVKGPPAIPGFDFLGVLGRGGMAIVYKARQLCPRRLVAVKVIHSCLADHGEVVARFRQSPCGAWWRRTATSASPAPAPS